MTEKDVKSSKVWSDDLNHFVFLFSFLFVIIIVIIRFFKYIATCIWSFLFQFWVYSNKSS